jgi:hypothetical protein
MKYQWIVWVCLAAAPMAAAQQTEERAIEMIQHEPWNIPIAPEHIQGEIPGLSHMAIPHVNGHTGVLVGTGLAAVADEPRTYLGVRLNPEPLPELLVKHLRLDPETGLRVQNVILGSPADKLGIEQDDLIVAVNGKPVKGFEEFVETIRGMEAGKSVELKIIHLGESKAVKATLETSKPGNEEWKYPQEPEISYSWNPGRVFRLQPGQKNWLEVPMEKMPDINSYFKKFMQEMYSYSHSEDGKTYTINIEGNPADPQTQVTILSEETEISTTVEKIDKLPEPYRKMARKDLDSALTAAQINQSLERNKLRRMPRATPPVPMEPIEPFALPAPPKAGGESMDKLQKEMKNLQKRLEQMEQEHQKSMEKLQKELEKMNQGETKPSA